MGSLVAMIDTDGQAQANLVTRTRLIVDIRFPWAVRWWKVQGRTIALFVSNLL